MTPEQAIGKMDLLNSECYNDTCTHDCEECAKALILAMTSLEKQIPKKVIGIEANMINRYCPNCKSWEYFDDNVQPKFIRKPKYCPNCGQRLNWEETK